MNCFLSTLVIFKDNTVVRSACTPRQQQIEESFVYLKAHTVCRTTACCLPFPLNLQLSPYFSHITFSFLLFLLYSLSGLVG